MKVTKENLHEYYNIPNGNIYCNGEIVDGFSEEDIRNAIDNNAIVEFYESTEATVNDIIRKEIESFIKEHWNPNFYLHKLPNGNTTAELSLLGDIEFSELVNGVLYKLSVICGILPKEATEWYNRVSMDILSVVHFNVPYDDISQIKDIEDRLENVNKNLSDKITKYDRLNKRHPLYVRFGEMLIEHKPVNQCGLVLKLIVQDMFHPNVFYVPSENKWKTGYTFGNLVSEMVYILGITHKEAAERYARATATLDNMIQYDADKEYFRLMLQHGKGSRTEKMLANDFAIHITKYLEQETDGKYDKNSLLEKFINELKQSSN